MLLQNLLEETPLNHQDYQNIVEAGNKIRAINSYRTWEISQSNVHINQSSNLLSFSLLKLVNEKKRYFEGRRKMAEVVENFQGKEKLVITLHNYISILFHSINHFYIFWLTMIDAWSPKQNSCKQSTCTFFLPSIRFSNLNRNWNTLLLRIYRYRTDQ